MWTYLKAAFWSRPRLPGLGDVPVLALAAGAFAILGILHPSIWLLGLGTVGGMCFGLATSDRFRKVVDAQRLAASTASRGPAPLPDLDAALDHESKRQLADLRARGAQVLALYREQGADALELSTTADALGKLQTLAARLLLQKQRLLEAEARTDARRLRSDIAQAERDLAAASLSDAARASRAATLELQRKRLDLSLQRENAVSEIVSDLDRIRAQVDLAHDEASLRGKPVAVSTKIDLASQMLDARLFGTTSVDLDPDFTQVRQ
jgi:hypothetical protein